MCYHHHAFLRSWRCVQLLQQHLISPVPPFHQSKNEIPLDMHHVHFWFSPNAQNGISRFGLRPTTQIWHCCYYDIAAMMSNLLKHWEKT